MKLRATWSLHDETGELIAGGTHRLDQLVDADRAIDPYEPAARIANFIEHALLEYLPQAGRADLLTADERQTRLFSDVVQ